MHPPPGIVQLCVINIPQQQSERWQRLLTSEELERMRRFRMPADQARFGITRGVLRALLAERLGKSPVFRLGEHDKPYIDGDLRFNVSHSGDFALIAIASGMEIGVDVERISDSRVVGEIAKRVLSPSEYATFMAIEEANRKRTFFQIWTLKEALLKGLGTGLSLGAETIEVAFYPREPRLLSCPIDEGNWTIQSLDIGDDNYAAAIAARRTGGIQIERIEIPGK